MASPLAMLASMVGNQYLGSRLIKMAGGLARRADKLAARAAVRTEVKMATRAAGLQEGQRLGTTARRAAVRTGRQRYNAFRSRVTSLSQDPGQFVERLGLMDQRSNRAIGRVFGGPRGTSFTGHLGQMVANDLATLPVTYAMYRYDKKQYPEMQDTSFARYYAQTIPFSLGWMAAAAAVKPLAGMAGRKVVHRLRQSGMGEALVKTGLTAGAGAAKLIGKNIAYMKELKATAMKERTPRDLLGMRHLKRMANDIGSFIRTTKLSSMRSPYSVDSDELRSRIQNSVRIRKIRGPEALKSMVEESAATLDKQSKFLSFVNSLLGPRARGEVTRAKTHIWVKGPQGHKVGTDVIKDRAILEFDGKEYDFGLFNMEKMKDYVGKSLSNFEVNTGFFGKMSPFKIMSSGMSFLQSDFQRAMSTMWTGGGARQLKWTDIIPHTAGIPTMAKIGADENQIEAEATKLVQRLFTDSKGEGITNDEAKNILLGLQHTRRDQGRFHRDFIEGARRGNLPLPEGHMIYLNRSGEAHFVTPSGAEFNLLPGHTARHITDNNNSAVAQALNRMSEPVSRSNEGLTGTQYSSAKSPDEILDYHVMQGGAPNEINLAWEHFRSKWELGGGGPSIFSILTGMVRKFGNKNYIHNIATGKNRELVINSLAGANTELGRSRAAGFIDVMDEAFTRGQERLFKIFDREGGYSTIHRVLTQSDLTVGGKSYKDMTLVGVNDLDTAIKRMSNMEEGLAGLRGLSTTLSHIRSALAQSNGKDIQKALRVTSHAGDVSFLDKYESMLLHNFAVRSEVPEGGVSASQLIFDTAKKLYPKSKMGDLEAYQSIIKMHRDIRSLGDIKANNPAAADEFAQISGGIADTLAGDETLFRRIAGMLETGPAFAHKDIARRNFVQQSEDTLFIVSDVGSMSARHRQIGNDLFMTNSVGAGGVVLMNSMETFNKSLGFIGLGVENYRGTQDLMLNIMKKRVLPMVGLAAGATAVDNFLDNSGLFEGTPLGEGLFMVGANAYAGVRLASQGVMDAVGITETARYMEDLMPGSINSPLSGAARGIAPFVGGMSLGYHMGGAKGGLTGGLIGGAVGMMLGGGPMGTLGDWDISKSRAELIAEFKGEKEVMVRKGRFWDLGSGSLWGEKVDYFRPHMYSMWRSDYRDSPNFQTNTLTEMMSYVDPSVYNRTHYFSRPSLEHPGMLSNVPIVGSLISTGSTASGLGGGTAGPSSGFDAEGFREDRRAMRSAVRGGADMTAIGHAAGAGPSRYQVDAFYPDPRSSSSLESRLQKTFYNLKEVAGLRGFLTETAQENLLGAGQLFSGSPEVEAPNIGSMGRSFWDMNLGGLLGSCFIAGSLVKTNDGMIPIEEIKEGDMILSKGDYRKVLATKKTNPGHHKILNIKAQMGVDIVCTETHHIPIVRRHKYKTKVKEWSDRNHDYMEIPAGEIQEGDYLLYAIDRTEQNHVLDLKRTGKCETDQWVYSRSSIEQAMAWEYLEQNPECSRSDMRQAGFSDYHAKEVRSLRSKNGEPSRIPRFISVDEDMAYAIGWFLAEGSTSYGHLTYSFGPTEVSYARKLETIFRSRGFHTHTRMPDSKLATIRFRVFSVQLSRLFRGLFGETSHVKRIPIEFKQLPTHILEHLVQGLLIGDGWTSEEGSSRTRTEFTSVSRQLTIDLAECILKLGVQTALTLDYLEPGKGVMPQGTDRKDSMRHYLSVLQGREQFRFYDGSYLCRIRKITEEKDRPSTVYDLEIEDIHYYTVDGVLVHNTEGIRRLFPRVTQDFQVYNPIRNLMPGWMPGGSYYINFQQGDPFAKVQQGEARLPGESYETLHSIMPTAPGEADLLGVSPEESMAYYSGNIEAIIPRYQWSDRIDQKRQDIVAGIKAMGSLIKEESMIYDTSKNITAYADATIETAEGEIVPVKFAPYLSKQGGFMTGSASSLNAYLVLSGMKKGIMVGIDEQGETIHSMVFANSDRYQEESHKDMLIRSRSVEAMRKRQEQGLPTAPGIVYSHFDRLRILADVAHWSNEFKNELAIVRAQIRNGMLGVQEEMKLEVILDQVNQKKQQHIFMQERFTPLLTGADAIGPDAQMAMEEARRYNIFEQTAGAIWEQATTMRNPLLRKLIGNRTALQAYEEDAVYGAGFKMWNTPIDSYIKPFMNQMAVETNPMQGAMSGATAGFIFGGPVGALAGGVGGGLWSVTGGQVMSSTGYIPTDVQKKRQIMAAADLAERQRYSQLYQMTGADEYKYRMRNTISATMESGAPITAGRLQTVASKPEKQYIQHILRSLNSENMAEARRLLPGNMVALMDRGMGMNSDARPEQFAGEYKVDSQVVGDYSIPLEDVIVKTFEREGLNAKDVGLNWQRDQMRMAAMRDMGIKIPAMNSTLDPEKKMSAKVNSMQLRQQLEQTLRGVSNEIIVESGDGPLQIVVEVI